MNKKWWDHGISFVLVSIILIALFLSFNNRQKKSQSAKNSEIESWINLDFINFDDPLHRSLFEESLNIFDQWNSNAHSELMVQIENYRKEQLLENIRSFDRSEPLNSSRFKELIWMYLKFIFIYIITLLLTFYGVETLGTYRFIQKQKKRQPYLMQIWQNFSTFKEWSNIAQAANLLKKAFILFAKAIFKSIGYLILFSPAYVLAYSFKTRFDTDMLFFMILLGVISNALLITYTQKFFTFLQTESRKGYVNTAIVKNMKNTYSINEKNGISYNKILSWRKTFPGHVFDHIFENAHLQYLSAVKEQASFLISGLIIIEMALNIQGHLCYELLQNILFRNYAVVVLIVLGIYWMVKATDITIDITLSLKQKRYHNT